MRYLVWLEIMRRKKGLQRRGPEDMAGHKRKWRDRVRKKSPGAGMLVTEFQVVSCFRVL